MISKILCDILSKEHEIFNEDCRNASEEYLDMVKAYLEKIALKNNNKCDKCEDKLSSYFHSIEDEFKNGERISHVEKEIKDGNVTKDINTKKEQIMETTDCGCKCGDNCCQNEQLSDKQLKELTQLEVDILREKLKEAKLTLKEQKEENRKLRQHLIKEQADKEYLLDKFEQVKNVFKTK